MAAVAAVVLVVPALMLLGRYLVTVGRVLLATLLGRRVLSVPVAVVVPIQQTLPVQPIER